MNGKGRRVRRISLASLAAAALIVAIPSGASAATTTIGQLAPAGTPATCANSNPFDHVQGSVTAGPSYVVPADGTITSWSHYAAPTPAGQQLKFKIFRAGALANQYQAISHDEPRDLTAGALNTFNVSIPVNAGDLIGLNDLTVNNACLFALPGESGARQRDGDLADGTSGIFTTGVNNEVRVNISAVLTTPNPLTATCKGNPATIIGNPGNDQLTGTPGPDVIAALAGKDKVSGLAGKDLICGGAGRDTLKGGAGKDRLLGQKGADTLKGGGGNDTCKGGKGADVEKSC